MQGMWASREEERDFWETVCRLMQVTFTTLSDTSKALRQPRFRVSQTTPHRCDTSEEFINWPSNSSGGVLCPDTQEATEGVIDLPMTLEGTGMVRRTTAQHSYKHQTADAYEGSPRGERMWHQPKKKSPFSPLV
ncbi:UNVERIFIED_CONTAM: hypothetical protein K2H54_060054 [Gekko kuhli]